MPAHDRVLVYQRAPRPELQPFVRRLLVVEFPDHHDDAHLPALGPIAAFTVRGRCELADGQSVGPAVFTGLTRKLRRHVHHDRHVVVLAAFTSVGAAGLLRVPLEDLTGTTTGLGSLMQHPERLDWLLEALSTTPLASRRVTLLEDYLAGRFQTVVPDPLVSAAAARLEQAGEDAVRIDALAGYIGLSQSALERRFRRVVGITPKAYASLARLTRAVQLREAGMDSTTAAYQAGFYDQSHFIHAFRDATGTTPDAFFA